jgi:ABC transporter substrate binding protein
MPAALTLPSRSLSSSGLAWSWRALIRFFSVGATNFVALAARHAVGVICYARESVTVGGLMSYGTSMGDVYHRAGVYTGKILKSAKPADPSVEQSTRFEFVINLKTDADRATSSSSTAAAMDYVQQRVGAARKRTLTGRAKPSSRWHSACARRAFMFAAEDRR